MRLRHGCKDCPTESPRRIIRHMNAGEVKRDKRYAEILSTYDFIILDDYGKSFSGDEKNLASYYSYGKEVLAPADGAVVAVYDKFPDCRITGNGQTDPSASDLGGNRVVIRHSEHEFSTLCHLMPKSITVKVGDKVRRGSVIGRCGNSGNTSEPHIHFQVQNTKSFYSSVGLPIRFRSIIKHAAVNYNKLDPRPLPNFVDVESCHIVRGLSVENMRDEL